MFDIGNILEPANLDAALLLLRDNPKLKVIAGGTDVLIRMHHRELEGAQLLSIRNIKGLKDISLLEDGSISIGAMATFSQIFRDEIINLYIPIVSESVSSIGGPQIRNMATIGGNICNGAVSADSATTMFVLNARLVLKSSSGERIVPIQEFYEGPGRVKLINGEILTNILISKDNYKSMSGCYIKYCNRKALDIATLGVSVLCSTKAGKFIDLRIALGVAAPTPIRCSEAEAFAIGLDVNKENIEKIGQEALKSSKARDSWRASKAYREHLIEILTQRGIKTAILRAGGEHIE